MKCALFAASLLAFGGAVTTHADVGAEAALEPALKAARELPRLYSLLVAQRGALIFEHYFNGRRATSSANVKSVSKSVIAALVGIAADRKLLSLNDPISKYFPDISDPAKRAILRPTDHALKPAPDVTRGRHPFAAQAGLVVSTTKPA